MAVLCCPCFFFGIGATYQLPKYRTSINVNNLSQNP